MTPTSCLVRILQVLSTKAGPVACNSWSFKETDNDKTKKKKKKKKKKKMMMMMMNNWRFYNFLKITVHVAVYFTYFESIEALAEHVVCLKKLKTSAFGSSEPLLLLRVMGMSAPSLHIE